LLRLGRGLWSVVGGMGDRGEKACLAASRAAALQAASSEPAPRHHCHSFCARVEDEAAGRRALRAGRAWLVCRGWSAAFATLGHPASISTDIRGRTARLGGRGCRSQWCIHPGMTPTAASTKARWIRAQISRRSISGRSHLTMAHLPCGTSATHLRSPIDAAS